MFSPYQWIDDDSTGRSLQARAGPVMLHRMFHAMGCLRS
jgi:hypothetical protein